MSEIGSIQPEPEFAAFIGIDWADQKHIWCLQAAGSAKRETGELKQTPEAIEFWVAVEISPSTSAFWSTIRGHRIDPETRC